MIRDDAQTMYLISKIHYRSNRWNRGKVAVTLPAGVALYATITIDDWEELAELSKTLLPERHPFETDIDWEIDRYPPAIYGRISPAPDPPYVPPKPVPPPPKPVPHRCALHRPYPNHYLHRKFPMCYVCSHHQERWDEYRRMVARRAKAKQEYEYYLRRYPLYDKADPVGRIKNTIPRVKVRRRKDTNA